jgi:hypothetical protein
MRVEGRATKKARKESMEEQKQGTTSDNGAQDFRSMMRSVIEEFMSGQQAKAEPAYKQELVEERRKREQLERRLNEMAEENRRSRQAAEELERSSSIRNELQRLGVTKVDLAFKAVKDEIVRTDDGRLIARTESGEVSAKEYLGRFLSENPELLPGRIQGGSGAGPGHKPPVTSGGFDLDKIKPGMSAEDLDRVRQEIARIANQTIRGI